MYVFFAADTALASAAALPPQAPAALNFECFSFSLVVFLPRFYRGIGVDVRVYARACT